MRENLIWLAILAVIILLSLMIRNYRSGVISETSVSILNRTVSLQIKEDGSDTLRAEFRIINSGNKRLVINRIDLDCNCTGYSLDKYTVEKNDTSILIVSIANEDLTGFTRNILVHCNTPETPVLLRVIAMPEKKLRK